MTGRGNHLGRVTTTDSGLFHVDHGVEIGQSVEAGEHVGTLYDPMGYETLQEVETDPADLLCTVTGEPTVTTGNSLVNVALPSRTDGNGRRTPAVGDAGRSELLLVEVGERPVADVPHPDVVAVGDGRVAHLLARAT